MDTWTIEPPDPGIAALCRRIDATVRMTALESCEGHPERPVMAHPYVVVYSADRAGVLDWVTRANARRPALPGAMFPDDRLITAVWDGELFEVRGQYVSGAENVRIIRALAEAL